MNRICTVKDLIDHLQTNFKPEDKLCRWIERGAYVNCEHILKSELGDRLFLYVSEDKIRCSKLFDTDLYNDCDWIDDKDVLIT